jgi:hypothetical protein
MGENFRHLFELWRPHRFNLWCISKTALLCDGCRSIGDRFYQWFSDEVYFARKRANAAGQRIVALWRIVQQLRRRELRIAIIPVEGPKAQEIVGADFLEAYHERFQQMHNQFVGYIRANPDGAQFFKSLSIEQVADMTCEIMPAHMNAQPPKYEGKDYRLVGAELPQ